MHWYVLQRYTEALRKLVAGKYQENTLDDTSEASDSGQWLKQIPMKRVCALSCKVKGACKGSEDTVTPCVEVCKKSTPPDTAVSVLPPVGLQDTPTALQDAPTALQDAPTALQDAPTPLQDAPTALQDTPTPLQDNSPTITAVQVNNPTTLQDTPTAIQDTSIFLQGTPTTLQVTALGHDPMSREPDTTCENGATTPKPHFSSHERGGLLLLVHKMKNALFERDIPASLPSPHDLIMELEQLLQSSTSQEVCSFQPSGVGVLSSRHSPSECVAPSKASGRKRNGVAISPKCRRLAKLEETASSEDTVADTSVKIDEAMPQCHVKSLLMDEKLLHLAAENPDKSIQPSSPTDSSPGTTCTPPHNMLHSQPTFSTTTPICFQLAPPLTGPLPTVSVFPLVQMSSAECQQKTLLEQVQPIMGACDTVLSASPAVLLVQEFMEATVTRIPNPAFSS